MSKAVLISIRPKWCEKIASGEKTIEVRKTRPKLKTPFKCYIYCTLPDTKEPRQILELHGVDGKIHKANGTVIGEFTCDRVAVIAYDGGMLSSTTNAAFSPATCLSQEEIIAYIGDKWRCYSCKMLRVRLCADGERVPLEQLELLPCMRREDGW